MTRGDPVRAVVLAGRVYKYMGEMVLNYPRVKLSETVNEGT